MAKPALHQNLVYYLLQFVTFLGTAGWAVYWLTMRIPMADWRFLAVGLLLAAVLGWWPLVSLGGMVALSVAVGLFANELDGEGKIQVIQEIAIFWALGLGWGVLARRWLAPPARPSQPPTSHLPPPPSVVRLAEDSTFRSRKLMAGSFEETNRESARHSVASVLPDSVNPDGPSFPVFKPPASEPAAPVVPPPSTPKPSPLPRPVLPPPPSYFGGESVYTPSLPGLPGKDSSHVYIDTVVPSAPDAPAHFFDPLAPPSQPGPLAVMPGAQTLEVRLDQMPPRPPVLDEPSVVPALEFPTMELPVNSLLRNSPKPSHNPNSSFHIPISSHGSSGSANDGSESDAQTIRRSSSFLRPETVPGSPYEHLLEWFNQFAWSP